MKNTKKKKLNLNDVVVDILVLADDFDAYIWLQPEKKQEELFRYLNRMMDAIGITGDDLGGRY
jgi:predicted urease superfamily metal-dependent hydrolase